MFKIATVYTAGLIAKFRSEEEGLALTEYLVLLGLLVSALILAVIAFGSGLANTWNTWSAWIEANLDAPSVSTN